LNILNTYLDNSYSPDASQTTLNFRDFLKKLFNDQGWKILIVPGDGLCLLNAIKYGVGNLEEITLDKFTEAIDAFFEIQKDHLIELETNTFIYKDNYKENIHNLHSQ